MSKKEIDSLVKRSPVLLACREENILQTADWIQYYLQLNNVKTLKKIVIKSPDILGYSVTMLEGKMKYYQETFGWTNTELTKVLTTTSRIISYSTKENIEPKRQWLCNTFNHVTKDDVSKLIKKSPLVLLANLNDMVDRLEFLQDQLELNSTQATWNLLWKAPNVLALTKDTLNDKISWFQSSSSSSSSSLGLTKKETAKLIKSLPTLLHTSIDNNLEPTLKWLNNRFGQAAVVKRMVTALPAILAYSIVEKTEPQLEFLQVTFGLNNASELSNMTCKYPSILGYNQASMEEKIQFYATCVGSRPDALDFIRRNPRLLGASLDQRLIPRWNQVLEFELPEHGFTVPISNLAVYSNAKWTLYLEKRKGRISNITEDASVM
ncbi:mitochondrial transcription termination [Seminavis robusta]|uniref:Mitochondrial transcription termination n=1 Tax=Seminavis robusta TaxID=568900 RepID=A0A9N8ECZ9_9STRA|nr:mitochondrial transcription termination [Seminavis robusta]|eukprot:Sro994_g229100.1 mitochondrial transcription termination (379) ;mRNA; f:38498-39634